MDNEREEGEVQIGNDNPLEKSSNLSVQEIVEAYRAVVKTREKRKEAEPQSFNLTQALQAAIDAKEKREGDKSDGQQE